MASGGSLVSTSLTRDAVTVRVQEPARSSTGSTVQVVGPPVTEKAAAPLVEQSSEIAASARVTGSLKVTVGFTVPGAVPPVAGVTAVTVGASSTGGSAVQVEVWVPSPSTVSAANPSHCTEGSKASLPSV